MQESQWVQLIRRCFEASHVDDAALIDDAAVLPSISPGGQRVVSTDAVVEEVDFSNDLYPPYWAGYRAIAQNLSDLASMGASPVGFVWSLAIPPKWQRNPDWVEQLTLGAAAAAAGTGLVLRGGDLSSTDGPLVCSITVFGDVAGRPLFRSGAQPGDDIWVSRPVGASGLGLQLLRESPQPSSGPDAFVAAQRRAVEEHLMPQAELALGVSLVGKAHACIDVSDGLLLDLARLAAASGVGATIEADDADLVDPCIHQLGASPDDALAAGEDYALIYAGPPAVMAQVAPAPAIRVGRVKEGEGLEHPDGTSVLPRGHSHL